jgi:hypothetical protein
MKTAFNRLASSAAFIGAVASPAAVLPFFLVWLAWERTRNRRTGCGPWPWRVWWSCWASLPGRCATTLFGKFVPVRSNFGLEFWLGNNPAALEVNAFQLHPLVNRAEAEEYRRIGEIAYMRAKQHAAFAFCGAHPGTTGYFTLCRTGARYGYRNKFFPAAVSIEGELVS